MRVIGRGGPHAASTLTLCRRHYWFSSLVPCRVESNSGALGANGPLPGFRCPLIEPCMRISRTRLSDKVFMPMITLACSAARRFWILLGVARFPNLLSFATSYANLEPGPLPSTSITRLHRYCQPLRHPIAPGLSLTGFRLAVTLGHATGFPVLHRSSSFMHAVATTPAEPLGACFARFPNGGSLPQLESGSASASQFSRPAQRFLTLRPA